MCKSPLQILPYQKVDASFTEWTEQYLVVAAAVIELISTEQLEALHIGSTSFRVGGKGIIDLMLLYNDQDQDQNNNLALATQHLFALGLQKQISEQPFPPERPRVDGAVAVDGHLYYLHVHVIARDSAEHKEKLAYKRYMLDNAQARIDYENTKKSILAEGITEQESYGKLKSPFVKMVLKEL